MSTPKFWPLDDDSDDPIYDSPAWDLPGYRKVARSSRPRGPFKHNGSRLSQSSRAAG